MSIKKKNYGNTPRVQFLPKNHQTLNVIHVDRSTVFKDTGHYW